ncbi:hypothetical protein ALC56_09578, partial [Trachymyrmex septentrionalis]
HNICFIMIDINSDACNVFKKLNMSEVVRKWKIRTVHLCILRFHKIKETEKLVLDVRDNIHRTF